MVWFPERDCPRDRVSVAIEATIKNEAEAAVEAGEKQESKGRPIHGGPGTKISFINMEEH